MKTAKKFADVNADGALNALDVTALLEKIAHLGIS